MGKAFKEYCELWDGSPPPLYIPNEWNIEVTGECGYNCPNCYGSKPKSYSHELSARQWLNIIDKADVNILLQDSIRRVILTGGEPLSYKDLGKLANGLKKRDIEVGLSTTGLDLNGILPRLLDQLDSIGIPIDGSSPQENALWRKHPTIRDSGLSIAVNALKLVQKQKPSLHTTIRTLVHSNNVDIVSKIPDFLEQTDIDITRLHWNLYELNTKQVPTEKYSYIDNYLVSTNAIASSQLGTERFNEAIQKVGNKFKQVTIKALGNIANINFMINPSGESRAVTLCESDRLGETWLGNLHDGFEDTIININRDIEVIAQLSEDASQSIEYFYHLQDKE